MAPKISGGKAGGKGTLPPEPDAAAALPPDLPAQCPFPYTWRPVVCALQVAEGLPAPSALREALRALGAPSLLSLAELEARLDAADQLAVELAAAAAAVAAAATGDTGMGDGGGTIPLHLAARLLQQRFKRDEDLGWRFELVRRRQALTHAELEARGLQDAAAAAATAMVEAQAHLADIAAKLPQNTVGGRAGNVKNVSDANAISIDTAVAAEEEEEDEQLVGSRGTGPQPSTGTADSPDADTHGLSPQQRHTLSLAQTDADAACQRAASAAAAASCAAQALAAASAGMDAPYELYDPYLLEGLSTSADGLAEAAKHAGIALRGVLWLHPPEHRVTKDDGTPAAPVEPVCDSSSGVKVPVRPSVMPGELQRLQQRTRLASWDSPLAHVVVLAVPVGDQRSPFTYVPCSSSSSSSIIVDPPWAAASRAAVTQPGSASSLPVAGSSNGAAAATSRSLAGGTAAAPSIATAPAGGKPHAPAAAQRSSGGGAKPGAPAVSSVSGGGGGGGAPAAGAAAAISSMHAASTGTPPAPEDVAGVRELARAVLTLRNVAAAYDHWRASTTVHRMPPPPAALACALCSSNGTDDDGLAAAESASTALAAAAPHYTHVLSGVPNELCSVPLLLHAVVEQVCHDMGEYQPGQGNPHTEATAAALATQLDSILASAVLQDSTSLLAPCRSREPQLTLVCEADELGAAVCGLTSGYPNAAESRCCGSSAAAALCSGGSGSSGLHSHMPAAPEHHPAERHMMQLAAWPPVAPVADADELERQLRNDQLRAHCGDRIALATVLRYELQHAITGMLPPGVREAHAEELLGRRHQAVLDADSLRQAAAAAAAALPNTARMRYTASGAELLCCFAGPEVERGGNGGDGDCAAITDAAARTPFRTLVFQEFMDELIASSGVSLPQPRSHVYELGAAAAARAASWGQVLAYTAHGDIAAHGKAAGSLLVIRDGGAGGALLRLCCSQSAAHKDKECRVLLTLRGGLLATLGRSPDAAREEPHVHDCSDAPTACSKHHDSGEGCASNDADSGDPAMESSSCTGTAAPQATTVPPASAEEELRTQQAGGVELRCVLPQGLIVELNSRGRVLLARVLAPHVAVRRQALDAAGVSVLGAPLPPGHLDAGSSVGPFAWHAVLPDGTLVKRVVLGVDAAVPAGPAGCYHGSSGVTTDNGGCSGRRHEMRRQLQGLHLQHPDGSTSEVVPCTLQLSELGISDGTLTAWGWLHTRPSGDRVWLLADGAEADLYQQAMAAAAEQAAAALAAAEAAEAAAASAAAAAEAAAADNNSRRPGGMRQGGVAVDRARVPEQRPNSSNKACSGGAGKPPYDAGGAPPSALNAVQQQQTPAAPLASSSLTQELLLQHLHDQMAGQTWAPLASATVVDPDCGAHVTTRADGLLLVVYEDGSRLLQDAEGCRLSFTGDDWTFEGPDLPQIYRDSSGVHVSLQQGTNMQWCAATCRTILEQPASGARLLATPCGLVGFTSHSGAAAPGALESLADLVQLLPPPQKNPLSSSPQRRPHVVAGAASADAPEAVDDKDTSSLLRAGVPPEQQQLSPLLPPRPLGQIWAPVTLAEACATPSCWGVLGINLMRGEAVMQEAEGLRLHIGQGGTLHVWRNDHVEQAQAAAAIVAVELAAAQEGVAMAQQHATAAALASKVAAAAAAVAAEAAKENGSGPNPTADSTSRAVALSDATAQPLDLLDRLDAEEHTAHAAAAAAAASTAAAANLCTAEALLAAATAAAAVPITPPVAVGVPPRVFVMLPQQHDGSSKTTPAGATGYEILPTLTAVDMFERSGTAAAAAAAAGARCSAITAPLAGGEPGSMCWTQMTTHTARGVEPPHLPLMQAAIVTPASLDPAASLNCLRRTDKPPLIAPAMRSPGGALLLPRAAARAACSFGGAAQYRRGAGCGAGETARFGTWLPSRQSAMDVVAPDKVVVVRRVLELPRLTPDMQAAAAEALAAVQHENQERAALLAARGPPVEARSPRTLAGAAEVAALLAAAAVPHDAADLLQHVCDEEAVHVWGTSTCAAATSPQARSACPAGLLVDVQQAQPTGSLAAGAPIAATSLAGTVSSAETLAQGEAATAATPAVSRHTNKPRRPWIRQPGPYDHLPKKPVPGQTLRYFHAQEGMGALSSDPTLTAMPPHPSAAGSCKRAVPLAPSAAGAQLVRGVYLSQHTTLLPPGEGGQESGGVAGNCNSGKDTRDCLVGQKTTINRGADNCNGGEDCKAPRSRTVHSPTRRKSGTAAGVAAAGGGGGGAAAADVPGTDTQPAGVRSCVRSGSAQGTGAVPNREYIHREGDALRTTKTSSASLLRLSGRQGGQLVVTPEQVCFGQVALGAVVHRSVRLLNASCDVARFSISRPAPPLRVMHRPGPLAPGMATTLSLELVGAAAGSFNDTVVVSTERAVLSLPVSATIINSELADVQKHEAPSVEVNEDDAGGSVVLQGAAVTSK